MPKIKFPKGISNTQHFGSGRGKIHVTKLPNGQVAVKRFRTEYIVSEEFYLNRLEVAPGYSDTGKYFKGFYWGSEKGIQERDNIYQRNFNRAIRNKYGDASAKIQLYARAMFERLGPEGRDKFSEIFASDIEEIFNYEDASARYFTEEYTRDIQQANTDINTLINDLESMFSPEEVARMRKEFNYSYYMKRYGMR